MHPVVLDKPYSFVSPYLGTWWPRFLQLFGRRKLRREYGLVDIQFRELNRLSDSLAAGHGIMLTPNHCRPNDPLIIGELCRRVGTAPLIMASRHIFLESWWKAFWLRRAGAFSVYREGMDRQTLQTAIDMLHQAKRPLVIFPEGVVTRTNDRIYLLGDALLCSKEMEYLGRPQTGPIHERLERLIDQVLVYTAHRSVLLSPLCERADTSAPSRRI